MVIMWLLKKSKVVWGAGNAFPALGIILLLLVAGAVSRIPSRKQSKTNHQLSDPSHRRGRVSQLPPAQRQPSRSVVLPPGLVPAKWSLPRKVIPKGQLLAAVTRGTPVPGDFVFIEDECETQKIQRHVDYTGAKIKHPVTVARLGNHGGLDRMTSWRDRCCFETERSHVYRQPDEVSARRKAVCENFAPRTLQTFFFE